MFILMANKGLYLQFANVSSALFWEELLKVPRLLEVGMLRAELFCILKVKMPRRALFCG